MRKRVFQKNSQIAIWHLVNINQQPTRLWWCQPERKVISEEARIRVFWTKITKETYIFNLWNKTMENRSQFKQNPQLSEFWFQVDLKDRKTLVEQLWQISNCAWNHQSWPCVKHRLTWDTKHINVLKGKLIMDSGAQGSSKRKCEKLGRSHRDVLRGAY